jgi:hypothetical protein
MKQASKLSFIPSKKRVQVHITTNYQGFMDFLLAVGILKTMPSLRLAQDAENNLELTLI